MSTASATRSTKLLPRLPISSEKGNEILGYAGDELPPSHSAFQELLHPDDKEEAAAAFNAHFASR